MKKFLTSVLIAGVVYSGYVLGSSTIFGHYSEGERTGVVTKLSHKGLFCKIWEGELAMQNVKIGADSVGNTFEFSVTDDAVREKIQAALDGGKTVAIQYAQDLFFNPCSRGSGYVAVGVTDR